MMRKSEKDLNCLIYLPKAYKKGFMKAMWMSHNYGGTLHLQ
jgi:hypothetical protein